MTERNLRNTLTSIHLASHAESASWRIQHLFNYMDKILKQVQDDRADLNNSVIGNSFGFAELKVQHLFHSRTVILKQVQDDGSSLADLSLVGIEAI